MTEPREALAALLHQRCKDDWEQRFKNGAVALTMHGVESHHDLADYLLAAGVHLGDEVGDADLAAAFAAGYEAALADRPEGPGPDAPSLNEGLREAVRVYLAAPMVCWEHEENCCSDWCLSCAAGLGYWNARKALRAALDQEGETP